MTDWPKKIKFRRILLSNDDGIAAPGLKVLLRIANKLSDDVWICAPETEQSGAAHSLTLHDPLRIRRLSKVRYAVNGTPTDCVLLGLQEILKDNPPDLLLSGVNRGANIGEDVTYSGTVAAAMEATILGVPAIALSLNIQNGQSKIHWPTAEKHAPPLIRKLCAAGWPEGTLINVNFPDCAPADVGPIKITRQGQRKILGNLDKRIDPRGRPYYWIGSLRSEAVAQPGTDLAAIEADQISITPIHLDLTNQPTLRPLKQIFG
ncbi:MAG: 5'/3'-nucleotidase SurE [Alphaproteobacteria bacterium]